MSEVSSPLPGDDTGHDLGWVAHVPLVAVATMVAVDAVALIFVAREPVYLLALLPIAVAALFASPFGSKGKVRE